MILFKIATMFLIIFLLVATFSLVLEIFDFFNLRKHSLRKDMNMSLAITLISLLLFIELYLINFIILVINILKMGSCS
jgi:hypothetical protein